MHPPQSSVLADAAVGPVGPLAAERIAAARAALGTVQIDRAMSWAVHTQSQWSTSPGIEAARAASSETSLAVPAVPQEQHMADTALAARSMAAAHHAHTSAAKLLPN